MQSHDVKLECGFIFSDHHRTWPSVCYNSMMNTLPCIVPRAAKRCTYEHTRGFSILEVLACLLL